MQLCNNIYNIYDKEKFDYYYPHTFEKELDYLKPDALNNVHKITIPINNTQEIELDFDASDSIENKSALIKIFNFRYELLFEEEMNITFPLIFNITKEKCEKYFNTRGIYFLSIDILSGEEEIETVILPYNCVIEIV